MKLYIFLTLIFGLSSFQLSQAYSTVNNVTSDPTAQESPSSSSYMCNIILRKYSTTEALRHPLTGVNIEIFNKTLQKTELNLKKHPQNRLSFHFKSGNEYVIMFRKEGFMIKRVNAKIGIDGCTACFDGLNTLTPLKEGERSSIVNLDLMMREINEGDRVILPTVQFQNKSADLSEDAKKALNELAVVLKDNANILSQLEVHTDARGTANDNLMLSKKRATTITEYLVSRGVSKGDFYVKGYGERKIVNHCTDNVDCAEVQHRKNRRIVFWLRAQIGENEIFNQSLASILGKSQSKFSATAQIAGDGKTVKKDGDKKDKVTQPKERPSSHVIAHSNPKPQPQMDLADDNNTVDESGMSKFSGNKLDAKAKTKSDAAAILNKNYEEKSFGSSSFTNQIDVTPKEIKDICNIDGIRPNERLNEKDLNDKKGIPSSKMPRGNVPGTDKISKQTEISFENGDAIVKRSGRATLVDVGYSGFKVELFTSERELDNKHEIFKRYGKIFLDDTGTAFSYMIGAFQYKDGAEKFMKTVIKPFYPEAKVIRYKDGKRK